MMLMRVDHHVHYHVIPRYDGGRKFADLEWVDSGWPAMPLMSESQHMMKVGVLDSIQDVLVSDLK